jgi:ribosomal protein S20
MSCLVTLASKFLLSHPLSTYIQWDTQAHSPREKKKGSSAMLPRHLQSLVARTHIRAAALSRQSQLSGISARQLYPAHAAFRITPSTSVAAFHSSARRQNEAPKSPFQTFVEVLREELKKNRELQDNVKQLQGDVDKFQDSEAMKKAKAAYEKARVSILFSLVHVSIDSFDFAVDLQY